eukprot:9913658-Ditylum_brightwellii.AAC.1
MEDDQIFHSIPEYMLIPSSASFFDNLGQTERETPSPSVFPSSQQNEPSPINEQATTRVTTAPSPSHNAFPSPHAFHPVPSPTGY